jgi:hypothetical protein
LAQRFFLLSHDHRTGKPRLELDVLGVGLAASTLADLTYGQAVVIDPGTGQVARITTEWPDDSASRYILKQIVDNEPTLYSASDWINVTRDFLYNGVAQALEEAGRVQAEKGRFGGGQRYVPTPRELGEEVLGQVYGVLNARNTLDMAPVGHLTLAAMCVAIGAASAVAALTAEAADAGYQAVIELLDPQIVTIARAATNIKNRLSMAPVRR